jgi:hypothetical protein
MLARFAPPRRAFVANARLAPPVLLLLIALLGVAAVAGLARYPPP